MMDFLTDISMFALKSFTLVIACLFLFAGLLSLKRKPTSKLELRILNEEHAALVDTMRKTLGHKKVEKKKKKEKNKTRSTLYVIDFQGDMKASEVEQLRDEVTAVLTVATPKDEVLVRIESPGGAVSGYGLAASQLQRIRDRKIPLTACVDKVAASGGYLMACVANQIIAAPFAIVGSIGVVAQMPNFHKWLQKHNIDVELLTAGEYKRTLTVFGENTEKGRKKFVEDLEKIHDNFSGYVFKNRQQVDIQQVATGEHWLANDALKLNLVDVISTSDDYIQSKMASWQVVKVVYSGKQSLVTRLLKPAARLFMAVP